MALSEHCEYWKDWYYKQFGYQYGELDRPTAVGQRASLHGLDISLMSKAAFKHGIPTWYLGYYVWLLNTKWSWWDFETINASNFEKRLKFAWEMSQSPCDSKYWTPDFYTQRKPQT